MYCIFAEKCSVKVLRKSVTYHLKLLKVNHSLVYKII